MKLYLIKVQEQSAINTYEEKLTQTKLVSSKVEEAVEKVVGAFTDKAVADFIVGNYLSGTTTSNVLKSNESGTTWKERETTKKYFTEEFDTEKRKAAVYDIPNSYKVLFFENVNVPIDQVRFVPGKSFEQLAAEAQNTKQPE